MLTLILLNPDERSKPQTFHVKGDQPEVLGRKARLIRLEDSRISRKHAEVSIQNGVWVIRDLGSSNGTLVNGERVVGLCELEEGDRLQIGRLTLIVGRVEVEQQAPDDHADQSGATANLSDGTAILPAELSDDQADAPAPPPADLPETLGDAPDAQEPLEVVELVEDNATLSSDSALELDTPAVPPQPEAEVSDDQPLDVDVLDAPTPAHDADDGSDELPLAEPEPASEEPAVVPPTAEPPSEPIAERTPPAPASELPPQAEADPPLTDAPPAEAELNDDALESEPGLSPYVVSEEQAAAALEEALHSHSEDQQPPADQDEQQPAEEQATPQEPSVAETSAAESFEPAAPNPVEQTPPPTEALPPQGFSDLDGEDEYSASAEIPPAVVQRPESPIDPSPARPLAEQPVAEDATPGDELTAEIDDADTPPAQTADDASDNDAPAVVGLSLDLPAPEVEAIEEPPASFSSASEDPIADALAVEGPASDDDARDAEDMAAPDDQAAAEVVSETSETPSLDSAEAPPAPTDEEPLLVAGGDVDWLDEELLDDEPAATIEDEPELTEDEAQAIAEAAALLEDVDEDAPVEVADESSPADHTEIVSEDEPETDLGFELEDPSELVDPEDERSLRSRSDVGLSPWKVVAAMLVVGGIAGGAYTLLQNYTPAPADDTNAVAPPPNAAPSNTTPSPTAEVTPDQAAPPTPEPAPTETAATPPADNPTDTRSAVAPDTESNFDEQTADPFSDSPVLELPTRTRDTSTAETTPPVIVTEAPVEPKPVVTPPVIAAEPDADATPTPEPEPEADPGLAEATDVQTPPNVEPETPPSPEPEATPTTVAQAPPVEVETPPAAAPSPTPTLDPTPELTESEVEPAPAESSDGPALAIATPADTLAEPVASAPTESLDPAANPSADAESSTAADTSSDTTSATEIEESAEATESPSAEPPLAVVGVAPDIAAPALSPAEAEIAAAIASAPRRVAYIVDASGSMVDSMNQGVLTWLEKHVRELDPADVFTILFFRSDELVETPPAGYKRAQGKMQADTLDWINPNARNIRPRGKSTPLDALRLAERYEATDIYILSDDKFGDLGSSSASVDADDIESQFSDRPLTVNTVQFFYQDSRDNLLQTIADHFDGTYEFVKEPPFELAPDLDLLAAPETQDPPSAEE